MNLPIVGSAVRVVDVSPRTWRTHAWARVSGRTGKVVEARQCRSHDGQFLVKLDGPSLSLQSTYDVWWLTAEELIVVPSPIPNDIVSKV